MKSKVYAMPFIWNTNTSFLKSVLLVSLLFGSFFSEAKTFRLNFVSSSYYTGTAVTGVDYTTSTVAALMTVAADGDTVQVYPNTYGERVRRFDFEVN